MKDLVTKQLLELMKGNQLLCDASSAGDFHDMTTLLMLVAKSDNDLITVPYYDVKQPNLWQDLFIWLFGRKIDDNEQQNYVRIKEFYTKTAKYKAQGWPIYLRKYKGKLLDRSPFNNLMQLKAAGSSYAALSQQADYNELVVIPRFNVVEAVANIFIQHEVWVDPYWLEEQSKDWGQRGPQFTKEKASLVNSRVNFDLPSVDGAQYKFVELQETNKDLD